MWDKMLFAGAATIALAAASGAWAAESHEVSELVVTGNSLEQTTPVELAKVGHDLAVVTGARIKDASYLDVSSALQSEVPGLYLAQQAGPFSYVYVSLQGSRTQDVLWTVDGVRINNRLYSSTAPTDTLPASMVERIEVLKGGESLFYGTQGVAGTINVVTRQFSDAFGGEVTIGADTNTSRHADGYVRGGVGQNRFVAFASYDQSDGFDTFDVYQPSATARKRAFEVTTGGLKYGLDITKDLSFSATYIHTQADLDYPGARLTAFARNSRDEDILSAKLDYAPDEGLQFFAKAYLHDWDSRYTTINNVVGQPGDRVLVDDDLYWGYKDVGANVLAKLPVGPVDFLAGYDFQSFEGRDEVLLIQQISEDVHAVFGQIRTNSAFSDRLSLAAGVRLNKTSETDTTVWNVSGRFEINPKLYVLGNAGTAFSLPTAEQLFAVDPFSTFGNPDLKAEESSNLNLSVGGRVADRVDWQLTGFARKVENLIAFSDDPALVPLSIQQRPDYSGEAYINLGEAKFSGFEASAAAQLADSWRLNGNVTVTRAREKGSNVQLDRIPEAFAKAQLSWAPEGGRFGASATAAWTGDVAQTVSGTRVNYGDSATLDLAAHVYLDAARKHRLTASLQNVFDETYATRVSSAPTDSGSPARFTYRYLGTPRTLSLRYGLTFGG